MMRLPVVSVFQHGLHYYIMMGAGGYMGVISLHGRKDLGPCMS